AVCGEVGLGDDADRVSFFLGAGARAAHAQNWGMGRRCARPWGRRVGCVRIALGADRAYEPVTVTFSAGLRTLDSGGRAPACMVATTGCPRRFGCGDFCRLPRAVD